MRTTKRCRTISSATSLAKPDGSAWQFTCTPVAAAAVISGWKAAIRYCWIRYSTIQALRKTNFVMLHGGSGGFEQFVPYLLMKPNVYADFSEQTWMTSPRHIAASIRFMLEFYPGKVLFGTDLYPLTPQVNWEETGYQTETAGRIALAIALTGMMDDGEITREEASEIARKVMRDNAIKLYGLSTKP